MGRVLTVDIIGRDRPLYGNEFGRMRFGNVSIADGHVIYYDQLILIEYIRLINEHPPFANGQFLFGTSERLRSLQCRIVWGEVTSLPNYLAVSE